MALVYLPVRLIVETEHTVLVYREGEKGDTDRSRISLGALSFKHRIFNST